MLLHFTRENETSIFYNCIHGIGGATHIFRYVYNIITRIKNIYWLFFLGGWGLTLSRDVVWESLRYTIKFKGTKRVDIPNSN